MEQRSSIGQIIGFLAKLVFLLGIIATGVLVWGVMQEPNQLRYTQISVKSTQWPPNWTPIRVVMVSDLHVGSPYIDIPKLQKIVDAINTAEPDVVLLVGSFMPGDFFRTKISPATFAPILGKIESKHGVFALPGREDVSVDGRQLTEALKSQGISVLTNSAMPIKLDSRKRFWIVGLGDNPQVYDSLVSKLPRAEPAITMMHNPARFPYVPSRLELVFAGYTHGGLVNIPSYPLPFLPSGVPMEYAYGMVETDGRKMFVSAGIGTNEYPIRLNNKPEIVVATILSGL